MGAQECACGVAHWGLTAQTDKLNLCQVDFRFIKYIVLYMKIMYVYLYGCNAEYSLYWQFSEPEVLWLCTLLMGRGSRIALIRIERTVWNLNFEFFRVGMFSSARFSLIFEMHDWVLLSRISISSSHFKSAASTRFRAPIRRLSAHRRVTALPPCGVLQTQIHAEPTAFEWTQASKAWFWKPGFWIYHSSVTMHGISSVFTECLKAGFVLYGLQGLSHYNYTAKVG